MSIKSTIAAVAATPLLVSGAAFAGPYVNLEATGSYPDGAYTSGGLEAVVGYEGETPNGIGWYVSGGPTVTHTESADEFGDTELIGYIGGGKAINDKVGVYGEISAATNVDDVEIGEVQYKNGLLSINLNKIVPEHQKRKVFDIS